MVELEVGDLVRLLSVPSAGVTLRVGATYLISDATPGRQLYRVGNKSWWLSRERFEKIEAEKSPFGWYRFDHKKITHHPATLEDRAILVDLIDLDGRTLRRQSLLNALACEEKNRTQAFWKPSVEGGTGNDVESGDLVRFNGDAGLIEGLRPGLHYLVDHAFFHGDLGSVAELFGIEEYVPLNLLDHVASCHDGILPWPFGCSAIHGVDANRRVNGLRQGVWSDAVPLGNLRQSVGITRTGSKDDTTAVRVWPEENAWPVTQAAPNLAAGNRITVEFEAIYRGRSGESYVVDVDQHEDGTGQRIKLSSYSVKQGNVRLTRKINEGDVLDGVRVIEICNDGTYRVKL